MFKTLPEDVGRVLSITSAEAAPGTSVTVHISITDATDMAGGDMTVKYDSSMITVDDVRTTDLVSGLSPTVNEGITGKIVIGMASMTGISSGSGALIDIDLTVNANAQIGTQTTLSFEEADIYNELGDVIPISLEDGVVKITEPGIKGDVNRDGKVRSNDAILTLRIATGQMTPTDYQQWAADMNGDGRVKSNDVILILRKATGLSTPGIGAVADSGMPTTVALVEVHSIAGETIAVPVKVDNAYGLGGGDICIAYDPAVLRAVDVSSQSGILLSCNVIRPGLVCIAFATPGRLRSRILAEVRFHILTDGASLLKLETVDLYHPNALRMDSRGVDGRFASWAIPPEHSMLLQNFPNPFNPDTWIPYQLKEDGDVTIRILSASGELVRGLSLGHRSAGLYVSQDRASYWDGKNEAGEHVSSGVYFYTIQAGEDFTDTKKMMVAR